jgi:hypothetical protein
MGALSTGRSCRFGVWLLAWLAFGTPINAQQPPPDSLVLSTRVDQERIRIGDPLRYTVTVTVPPGAAVQWPARGQALGGFEILSLDHRGPAASPAGAASDTLQYTLTIFTTGVHVIPPFVLSCGLPDGKIQTAVADSIPITVVSVIEDEATDIRDLKGPADIPETTPWYVWAGLAALFAGFALAALYLYRRWRRKERQPAPAPAPGRLPHEIALEELDQLARAGLLAQGQVKQHYTVLSEILRRYLAARYRVNAMEVTTSELMEALGRVDVSIAHRQPIADLLRTCDLVKFAKFIPETERQKASIEEAAALIESTKQTVPLEAPQRAAVAQGVPEA